MAEMFKLVIACTLMMQREGLLNSEPKVNAFFSEERVYMKRLHVQIAYFLFVPLDLCAQSQDRKN